MIDNDTLTLLELPEEEKYDDELSAITQDYEVITTFMKIHNISATWEPVPWVYDTSNSSHQLIVGPYLCVEGDVLECCPSM